MSLRRDARILVVEDNDTLRGGVALALRESWSEVEEAASGEEALERIHDAGESFDVVLTSGCRAPMVWPCCAPRASAIPARACC